MLFTRGRRVFVVALCACVIGGGGNLDAQRVNPATAAAQLKGLADDVPEVMNALRSALGRAPATVEDAGSALTLPAIRVLIAKYGRTWSSLRQPILDSLPPPQSVTAVLAQASLRTAITNLDRNGVVALTAAGGLRQLMDEVQRVAPNTKIDWGRGTIRFTSSIDPTDFYEVRLLRPLAAGGLAMGCIAISDYCILTQ